MHQSSSLIGLLVIFSVFLLIIIKNIEIKRSHHFNDEQNNAIECGLLADVIYALLTFIIFDSQFNRLDAYIIEIFKIKYFDFHFDKKKIVFKSEIQ